MSEEVNRGDLSEIIAENFGANATYVEGLLNRYRSNPSLVDDAWRAYFNELLGESAAGDGASASASGNGSAWPVGQEAQPASAQAPRTVASAPPPAQAPASGAQSSEAATTQPAQKPSPESQPIRGGALKIVENMETSLAVPTATSNRAVPVKLLEENRRIINQYLQGAEARQDFLHASSSRGRSFARSKNSRNSTTATLT